MGNMTRIQTRLGSPLHRGGHAHDVSAITNAAGDGITALTRLDWTTSTPTVIRKAKPTSVAKADQAEMQAHQFDVAVDQGVRVLRAEAKKQKAAAKLHKAQRQYLGTTAQCHLEMSADNVHLATKLQSVRVAQANLGYGLERRIATADQQIAQIAAKYGAIG